MSGSEQANITVLGYETGSRTEEKSFGNEREEIGRGSPISG
jgi:hypothetical protein